MSITHTLREVGRRHKSAHTLIATKKKKAPTAWGADLSSGRVRIDVMNYVKSVKDNETGSVKFVENKDDANTSAVSNFTMVPASGFTSEVMMKLCDDIMARL